MGGADESLILLKGKMLEKESYLADVFVKRNRVLWYFNLDKYLPDVGLYRSWMHTEQIVYKGAYYLASAQSSLNKVDFALHRILKLFSGLYRGSSA